MTLGNRCLLCDGGLITGGWRPSDVPLADRRLPGGHLAAVLALHYTRMDITSDVTALCATCGSLLAETQLLTERSLRLAAEAEVDRWLSTGVDQSHLSVAEIPGNLERSCLSAAWTAGDAERSCLLAAETVCSAEWSSLPAAEAAESAERFCLPAMETAETSELPCLAAVETLEDARLSCPPGAEIDDSAEPPCLQIADTDVGAERSWVVTRTQSSCRGACVRCLAKQKCHSQLTTLRRQLTDRLPVQSSQLQELFTLADRRTAETPTTTGHRPTADDVGKEHKEHRPATPAGFGGRRFPCRHCPKVLSCRTTLLGHEVRLHNRPAPHRCQKCGKRFLFLSEAKRHELTLHLGLGTTKRPLARVRQRSGDPQAPKRYEAKRKQRQVKTPIVSSNRKSSTRGLENRAVSTAGDTHLGSSTPQLEARSGAEAGGRSLPPEQTVHRYSSSVTCRLCSKVMANGQSMKKHMVRVHRAAAKYACPFLSCGKQCIYVSDMRRHLRQHPIASAHRCIKCGGCFGSEQDLLKHAKNHRKRCFAPAESGRFLCTSCDQTFSCKQTLWKHMVLLHNAPGRFKCTQCRKQYPYQALAERHARTNRHLLCGPFVCLVCGVRFVINIDLAWHVKTHGGDGAAAVATTSLWPGGCAQDADRPDETRETELGTYNKEQTVTEHRRNTTSEMTGDVMQTVPGGKRKGVRSTSGASRDYGVKTLRTERMCIKTSSRERIATCDACNKTFSHVAALKVHRVRRHGAPGNVSCSRCARQFLFQSELIRHERHCHPRPSRCAKCGRGFRSLAWFQLHLRRGCVGDGAYTTARDKHRTSPCDGKSRPVGPGAKKKKLKKGHMCKDCGLGTLTLFFLRVHRIKAHNAPGHKCDVCSKVFATSYHLHRHLLVHTRG